MILLASPNMLSLELMNDLLQFCACIFTIVIQTQKTQLDSWEGDGEEFGFVMLNFLTGISHLSMYNPNGFQIIWKT